MRERYKIVSPREEIKDMFGPLNKADKRCAKVLFKTNFGDFGPRRYPVHIGMHNRHFVRRILIDEGEGRTAEMPLGFQRCTDAGDKPCFPAAKRPRKSNNIPRPQEAGEFCTRLFGLCR